MSGVAAVVVRGVFDHADAALAGTDGMEPDDWLGLGVFLLTLLPTPLVIGVAVSLVWRAGRPEAGPTRRP